MPLARRIQVNTVRVDNKRRIVLPKDLHLAEYYAVEVTEDEEIILRPRALVDPRETINKKTLMVLDESMKNLSEGKAGKPVDLSAFDVSADMAENEQEQVKARHAKFRRR